MASLSSPPTQNTIVQPGRIRVIKEGSRGQVGGGPVVYWMFRDQRLKDNWALIHAVDQANRSNVPIAVAFNLFDQFLGAKARQLGFMLRGLCQLQSHIEETLQIPFFLFLVSFIRMLNETRLVFSVLLVVICVLFWGALIDGDENIQTSIIKKEKRLKL
jgi:hypothetical protein